MPLCNKRAWHVLTADRPLDSELDLISSSHGSMLQEWSLSSEVPAQLRASCQYRRCMRGASLQDSCSGIWPTMQRFHVHAWQGAVIMQRTQFNCPRC